MVGNFEKLTPPKGDPITVDGGKLRIPDHPIVPFIEGDGTGVDITPPSLRLLDAAVDLAYGGKRRIAWFEVFAGEKAMAKYGAILPNDTLEAIRRHYVAIKGPLTTPVGGGFRSVNVTLRQVLDLYDCVRPVRWYQGVPSPVREPHKVDVVIHRENTEDVYAGFEWAAGTAQANRLIEFLRTELKANVRERSGIGIKPISEFGSKRLVRKAIQDALVKGRTSVTLMHKGNIMKFTEGAFKDWGYQVAKEEFGPQTITETELTDSYGGKVPKGKVVLKDRIADNMFQQILIRPDEYEVVATPNLNGDYFSDACAAQVGGLGIAPGANIGDHHAVFEATHGSAPKYAGQDKVNPGSLILSGVMMLEYLGWTEAAHMVENALEKTISEKKVTYDLARQMGGVQPLSTSKFADAVTKNLATVEATTR